MGIFSERRIARNLENIEKQFFIDRQGKIIKLDTTNFEIDDDYVSIHYEIANQVLPHAKDAKKQLMDWGWIMIGSSVYSAPIIDKKPTELQVQTLINIGKYDRFCILQKGYYINYNEFLNEL